MSKLTDDGVKWYLPPVIEEANFFSETLQIPTYLEKLGDYKAVQDFFGGGEGVMVGVCDTGIAKSHLTTGGELFGRGVVAKDFTNSASDFDDLHGHGTHVAHHIVSTKIGLAPKAEVRIAKVLGDNGSGSSVGIANGLRWLKEEFDKSDSHTLLVNMSLGGGFSSTIANAITEIIADENVIVFAAIGNSGGTPDQERGGYPGALDTTFGIGAVDYNNKIASFSSRSSFVDMVDYGVSVLSCGTQRNQYRRLSGTSMATPCACGLAALAIGKFKELEMDSSTKDKYFNLINGFLIDLGDQGKDKEYGNGKLDFLKLMDFLKGEDDPGEDDPGEDDPGEDEPDKECPPSKLVEKFIVPRRRNTTIEKMTWYNKDGSIQQEDIKETSRVVVWQLYTERERDLPNEPELKVVEGEDFDLKDFDLS